MEIALTLCLVSRSDFNLTWLLESLRGTFISVYAPVNSATLICKLTGKFWDSGKYFQSTQTPRAAFVKSCDVTWCFFFFPAAPYGPYNMLCTEVLTALLAGKAYTLTVLSDIGAFPRPGENGRLTARQGLLWSQDSKDVIQDEEQRVNHPIHRQLTEMQVQISWDAAGYFPTGHIS